MAGLKNALPALTARIALSGLWQKFQFYESSCGVPLLIRAPQAAPGGVCHTPVSLVQLLPTLCDLCGVPAVRPADGPSLVPDLRTPGRTRETSVFAEFNLRTPRAKYMLRRGDFKFTFRVNDMPELYNLNTDPGEMKNLALLPEYKGKVEELRQELFAWYTPTETGLKQASKQAG